MRVLIGIVVVVVILFGVGCSGYTKVVRLDQAAQAQFANIDVQLQRRYDLIPNLVETVKGYAAHEKGVFDDVANSRAAYTQARTTDEKTAAANHVESALSRLLAIREAYPQLKANESFLKLQDQLEGTENRLSVERQRYNDTVRDLNAFLRFPTGLIGNLFAGVKPREYLAAPEAARAAPKVDFAATAPTAEAAPAPAAPVPTP
jgi:LemA protein